MTYSVTPAASHQDVFRQKERIFRNFSKKLLVVGDSRANDFARYGDLIGIGYTPDRVINLGVPGTNFGDNIWFSNNCALTATELSEINNILFICGVNEMTSNTVYDVAAARAALDEWVLSWKAKCPGARAIVSNIFERGPSGFYSESRRQAFNTAIDSPPAAPYNAIVRPAPMAPSDTTYFQIDQLHLTKAGVDAFLVPAFSKQI